jgi:uncharacterized circularly permuted ATP-grasp superfamily protein
MVIISRQRNDGMPSKWDPSKWELHRSYAKHPSIRKRLPPTTILSRTSLSRYLNHYESVYIKGKNEHTGSGIIKAWKTKKGYRFVKVKGKPIDAHSIKSLYQKVKDGRRSRSIIVQKTIDLAKIDGRPYSIRLMLMRNGSRKWKYAGMIAKVSGKSSVVSNVRRGGGYATTIEDALARSLGYGRERIARKKRKLIRLGYEIVNHAIASGYLSHEVGLDLGIDKHGEIWIIEVNLAYPSYGLFNRLKGKTFYRRIRRLAEEYKRYGRR